MGGISINLLSNFEANFIVFLKSLGISRTGLKRLLSDWKAFIRFLELTFPDKLDSLSPSQLLSPTITKRFATFYLKKTHNPNRVKTITEIFTRFKNTPGVKTHQVCAAHTWCVDEENFWQPLIFQFLRKLQKDAAPSSTIRNYKSDLIQFFSFLDNQEVKTPRQGNTPGVCRRRNTTPGVEELPRCL